MTVLSKVKFLSKKCGIVYRICRSIKFTTVQSITWCIYKFRIHPKWVGGKYIPSEKLEVNNEAQLGKQNIKLIASEKQKFKQRELPKNSSLENLNNQKNHSGSTFLNEYGIDVGFREIAEIKSLLLFASSDEYSNEFYSISTSTGKFLIAQGLSVTNEAIDFVYSKTNKTLAVKKLSAVCFCLEPWYGNYFHWLINVLPKVNYLRQQLGVDMPDLVIGRFTKEFDYVINSLSYLGIPNEKVKFLDDGVYSVDRLYLPQVSPFNKELLESVRDGIQGHLSISRPLKTKKRLYISRRNAWKRRLECEDALVKKLIPLGFQIIESEHLNFSDQVHLFSEADVVCSLHGAGLSNILFLPPSSKVIEVVDVNDPVPLFYSLAATLGLQYWLVEGWSDEKSKKEGEADVYVDINTVMNVVYDVLTDD
jgi:hypothetical protein